MIKFNKQFGYAEILSILTLLFSIYTYSLLQSKEDKENYNVSIKSVEQFWMTDKPIEAYYTDTFFIYAHKYLVNNIGTRTLTLNSIEDASLNTSIAVLSTTNIGGRPDTMMLSLYPTSLSFDTLKRWFTTKKITSADLIKLETRLFDIKLNPGESATVTVLFTADYKELYKQHEKHYFDSTLYLYTSNLKFNFSTGYSKSIDVYFTKYQMEKDPHETDSW